MRLSLICLLCSLALPATAQIYKYTDAQGNTVFSDQAPQGVASEQVTLPAVNTVQPPPMPTLEATGGEPAATGQAYSTLRLLGLPADDGALRANNGTFSVNVELRPALRANHRLRLVLDGQPHGPATRGSQLQVVNAARGEQEQQGGGDGGNSLHGCFSSGASWAMRARASAACGAAGNRAANRRYSISADSGLCRMRS